MIHTFQRDDHYHRPRPDRGRLGRASTTILSVLEGDASLILIVSDSNARETTRLKDNCPVGRIKP